MSEQSATEKISVWVPGVAEKVTPASEEELRAYLEAADRAAEATAYPTLVELFVELSGRNLSIGVGDPSISVAVWTDPESSFTSLSPGEQSVSEPGDDDDDFGFWFGDSWSEFAPETAITKDTARQLAVEFWRSNGARPTGVEWKAV